LTRCLGGQLFNVTLDRLWHDYAMTLEQEQEFDRLRAKNAELRQMLTTGQAQGVQLAQSTRNFPVSQFGLTAERVIQILLDEDQGGRA
jgi:capsid protein